MLLSDYSLTVYVEPGIDKTMPLSIAAKLVYCTIKMTLSETIVGKAS